MNKNGSQNGPLVLNEPAKVSRSPSLRSMPSEPIQSSMNF